MSNKYFGITVFSAIQCGLFFIWAVLIGIMARDLRDSVIILEEEKSRLEQQIIDYKWQLEQVPYICGGINEE